MSIQDIGPLRAADEGLNHQIADTFATIAESDRSWTEKIWASIARTDGSLQLDFGLGKYHNRGIIDGFGGVSRGREQWTVRGSRELDSAPEQGAIGPIRYEIMSEKAIYRSRTDPGAPVLPRPERGRECRNPHRSSGSNRSRVRIRSARQRTRRRQRTRLHWECVRVG